MCERPIKTYMWSPDGTYKIKTQYKCRTCRQCKDQYVSGLRFRIALQFLQPKEHDPQRWDLTYREDTLPEDNKPIYAHYQGFQKRLRQRMRRRGYKGKIQYFVTTENAPNTNRLHLHAIIWGLPYRPTLKEQNQFWPYGRSRAVIIDNPEASGKYLTKYVTKSTYQATHHPPKIKFSLRPYIGEQTIIDNCNALIEADNIPSEIGGIYNLWTRKDDPSSATKFYCPKYFRDLQTKIYTAAGARFPEYSSIASELKIHKDLVQPDLEAVRKASTATRKRDLRHEDAIARYPYTQYNKSIKTLIKDRHDDLNLTKDLPDDS